MAEKPAGGSFVDTKAIRLLTKVLHESDLTELEYQEGETRIRVVKHPGQVVVTPGQVENRNAAPMGGSDPVQPISATHDDVQGSAVTSPIVGTVYVAPEPGAAPYVKTGDQVEEGQTLLIVEAMKVMNPIRAPKAGKISKICISDGTPVEFGEDLLYIA